MNRLVYKPTNKNIKVEATTLKDAMLLKAKYGCDFVATCEPIVVPNEMSEKQRAMRVVVKKK